MKQAYKTFEHKAGLGTLFQNYKRTHEKAPDLQGEATLPNGEKVKIAAWKKKDKKDRDYLSLKIQ